MPLLVGEHHHIDAGIAACFLDRARGLERVDAAERAIEPAGVILRFQVRAGKDFAAASPALSQNVADAVDRCLEPGFSAPLREPRARRDILRRKRRAVNAGIEVGQDIFIENYMTAADLGVKQTSDAIATRGERLTLIRSRSE